MVENKVYLKVSPSKGAVIFVSIGKLKPRYTGPFDIIAKVEDLVYELAFPPNIGGVHNVCHVSMLKKYVRDDSHIIPNYTKLDIQPNANYEESH